MLLDGALNILFFLVFISIAYLWMPTLNNERYGLDQLPQDDFDEIHVLSDDDSPIKLRNLKSEREVDEETVEDILAWAEEHVQDETTPSSSVGDLYRK